MRTYSWANKRTANATKSKAIAQSKLAKTAAAQLLRQTTGIGLGGVATPPATPGLRGTPTMPAAGAAAGAAIAAAANAAAANPPAAQL